MVVNCLIALQQRVKALKQMLQTQVSAHAFVEGMFVEDHAIRLLWATQLACNDNRSKPR